MDVQEFIREVDWTEPWLLGLLGFHITTAVAVVLLRKHHYAQACILAVLAVLCFSSERINEYAAMNYELFAKEQYFDDSGFFIFMVFAAPIIFNCFLIVAFLHPEMTTLFVANSVIIAVLAMERLGSDGEDGAAKARRQQKRTERPNRETKKQQ